MSPNSDFDSPKTRETPSKQTSTAPEVPVDLGDTPPSSAAAGVENVGDEEEDDEGLWRITSFDGDKVNWTLVRPKQSSAAAVAASSSDSDTDAEETAASKTGNQIMLEESPKTQSDAAPASPAPSDQQFKYKNRWVDVRGVTKKGSWYTGTNNAGKEIKVNGKDKVRPKPETGLLAGGLFLDSVTPDASPSSAPARGPGIIMLKETPPKAASSTDSDNAEETPPRPNAVGPNPTVNKIKTGMNKVNNGQTFMVEDKKGTRMYKKINGKKHVKIYDSRRDPNVLVNPDAKSDRLAAISAKLRQPSKHHVPAGELTEMLANMTDDWASSEDELNFAEESETEEMQFAESSAAEHNDSGSLEFAESSAIETDSDNDFATTSTAEKTSSGLEFAESSAVESDSAKENGSSSGLGWAESSDYD